MPVDNNSSLLLQGIQDIKHKICSLKKEQVSIREDFMNFSAPVGVPSAHEFSGSEEKEEYSDNERFD